MPTEAAMRSRDASAYSSHDGSSSSDPPQSCLSIRPIRQINAPKRFDESHHSVLPFRPLSKHPRLPSLQNAIRPENDNSRALIHSDDEDWWSDIQETKRIDEENLVGSQNTQPQASYAVAREEDNDSLLAYSSDEDDLEEMEQQVLYDEQNEDNSILDDYSDFGEGFYQMTMEEEDDVNESQQLQVLLAQHEARQKEDNRESQESARTETQIGRVVDHDNVRR